LTDPAAASSSINSLIKQLRREYRGMSAGRAAPGLPSASTSSLYELARLGAGQPRRDPQPKSLKLPLAL
jgi:hypothetical protein